MNENTCLRGSLSAYAKWAGITLNAAKQRNRRGKVVMDEKFPWMVDFVRSNAAVGGRGRPVKRRNSKKIHINIWVTPQQWRLIQRIVKSE